MITQANKAVYRSTSVADDYTIGPAAWSRIEKTLWRRVSVKFKSYMHPRRRLFGQKYRVSKASKASLPTRSDSRQSLTTSSPLNATHNGRAMDEVALPFCKSSTVVTTLENEVINNHPDGLRINPVITRAASPSPQAGKPNAFTVGEEAPAEDESWQIRCRKLYRDNHRLAVHLQAMTDELAHEKAERYEERLKECEQQNRALAAEFKRLSVKYQQQQAHSHPIHNGSPKELLVRALSSKTQIRTMESRIRHLTAEKIVAEMKAANASALCEHWKQLYTLKDVALEAMKLKLEAASEAQSTKLTLTIPAPVPGPPPAPVLTELSAEPPRFAAGDQQVDQASAVSIGLLECAAKDTLPHLAELGQPEQVDSRTSWLSDLDSDFVSTLSPASSFVPPSSRETHNKPYQTYQPYRVPATTNRFSNSSSDMAQSRALQTTYQAYRRFSVSSSDMVSPNSPSTITEGTPSDFTLSPRHAEAASSFGTLRANAKKVCAVHDILVESDNVRDDGVIESTAGAREEDADLALWIKFNT